MAFAPKALLFGADDAVLLYNCFPKILSALFNLIFGIPPTGYFGDFGAIIPYELSRDAIEAFVEFCATLGIHLETKKAEVGRREYFWGIRGTFPRPEDGMARAIKLPPSNAKTSTATLERIIETRPIARKDLESVIGRLSFTRTSVFGRIGRSMRAPLYKKLHMGKYIPALSLIEATSLGRRAASLAHVKHREATPKHPMAERIVYSDAAGKSQIIATVRRKPGTFDSSNRIGPIRPSKTGDRRRKTFGETCYIYGLEVLAVLAILLLGKCNELRDKSVTFYIDNNNAICALGKNEAGPSEIQAMVGLVCNRIRDIRTTPWFDRVPPKTQYCGPAHEREEDRL